VGVGEVIKGWDVGVGAMSKGCKRAMLVPPQMGYGRRGAPPDIPGNSTLYFEVELM
jgi:FKBP-type peptidyl-prolyl cis-trans isomerase